MNFIQVTEGKNSWKRYLSSLILIVIILALSSLPYLLTADYIVNSDGDPNTYYDFEKQVYVGLNPLIDFTLANSSFFIWLFGIFLVMRFVHKRPLLSLITPNKKMNWKRVFWGFGVFFLLLSCSFVVDVLLNRDDYALNNFKMVEFLILFVLVLIMTPIQTTTEEVVFRGYLMQLIGKKIHNLIVLSAIAGLIFASLHFANPEMSYSPILVGLDYVFAGVLWCYITAKTNSAELTIGAHAANNMILGWFITMENSTFGNIPSLFVVTDLNPAISLTWTILTLGVFTYVSVNKFGNEKISVD